MIFVGRRAALLAMNLLPQVVHTDWAASPAPAGKLRSQDESSEQYTPPRGEDTSRKCSMTAGRAPFPALAEARYRDSRACPDLR